MITFDTGVLIGLERRDKVTWDRFRRLRERRVPILVPASCLSEWWRGAKDRVEIRRALSPFVVPLTERIAIAAGEALASRRRARKVGAALTIDAQVMATAALAGGGAVLTADREDLEFFARHFPNVVIERL